MGKMQPKETKEAMLPSDIRIRDASSKSKLVQTAFVCISCVLVGIYTNILGPSLLEVEYFTGSTTATVSSLFLWRHGGYLLGSLLVGTAVDKVNEYFIICASFVVMMVAVAVSPWWRELVVFGVMFAIGGAANCFCVACLVFAIIRIWKAKSDPFQQAAFFSLNIGTALSPQVFKAFLGTHRELNTITEGIANSSALPRGSIRPVLTEANMSLQSSTLTWINDDNDITTLAQDFEITFQYGYIIISLCLLCGFILNCLIICCNGLRLKRSEAKSHDKNAGGLETRAQITGIPKALVLTLQFLLGLLMSAIEESFTGLLITFLVKHLGWANKVATDMITAYLAASATSRGLGIIVSRFVRASYLLAVLALSTLTGYILLTFALESHWIIPWLSSALIGLGFGAFYPALINWENSCMQLRGKETSIIFISVSVGKMTSPFLVGYLFEEHNPKWFVHIGLIYSVCLLCMYIVKSGAVKYFLRKVRTRNALKCDNTYETDIVGNGLLQK